MHEGEVADAGQDGVEHRDRLGPLQRQQRAVVGAGQFGAASQPGLDEAPVGLFGAGIDDHVERAAIERRAADHQIVARAALVVEQQGVAELAGLQPGNVA